ncbi:MAG: enterochelin esterase [Gemmatimonadota bacterium]
MLSFLVFVLALLAPLPSQRTSPRISALAADLTAKKPNAEAAFWSAVAQTGTPFIDPYPEDRNQRLVTFVYHGDGKTTNVMLSGGPEATFHPLDNAFDKLEGTDVWWRTYVIASDARFTYKLAVNADTATFDLKHMDAVMKWFGAAVLDPANRRQFPATDKVPAVYRNSVVELPNAPRQPWVAARVSTPHGKVDSLMVKSAILENERAVSVYTPPGYDPKKSPYPLLIVFDRDAYLHLVPTPTILDNLTGAGRIPAQVAVLIGNPGATRNAELPCNRKFADFLATELVPWVKERYNVTDDPAKTTVAGSSYGGLASTCAGLFHPERFRNILSQSGSYWWPDSTSEAHEWVYRQFEKSDKLPLRFYQDVGLMENKPTPNNGPSMVDANRKLRDLLKSKGYEVHYAEFDGGHEYLNWQGTLADGLLALIGHR